jgi:hypothetical protein
MKLILLLTIQKIIKINKINKKNIKENTSLLTLFTNLSIKFIIVYPYMLGS